MTKKNQNRKDSKPALTGKSDRRGKASRARRVAAWEASLLGKARKPRDDRHVLVAMTMASLVAGLLFVINFDRTTHAAAALKLGKGTSLHGWPFIYLHREFESLPAYLIATRINEWPIPVAPGETRTINYLNLSLDVLFCGVLVLLCFYLVRSTVFRYDQWKKTWK